MIIRKEDLLQEEIGETAPWLSLTAYLRVRLTAAKNGFATEGVMPSAGMIRENRFEFLWNTAKRS